LCRGDSPPLANRLPNRISSATGSPPTLNALTACRWVQGGIAAGLPHRVVLAVIRSIHPVANRCGVRVYCTVRPGCAHRQHRREPMSVLLGDQQRIASDHEVPAHRRVARYIGLPIANGQPAECASSAHVRVPQIRNRCSRLSEEQVVVRLRDLSGAAVRAIGAVVR
jgi:hypothetical protein